MMRSRAIMRVGLTLTLLASLLPGQQRNRAKERATETFGITALPTNNNARLGHVSVRTLHREGFTKCVAVHKRPTGAIWIVAQEGVRNIAIARAKNLLKFYLKPRPNAAAARAGPSGAQVLQLSEAGQLRRKRAAHAVIVVVQ